MVTMSSYPCSCSWSVWNSPVLDVSRSPTHALSLAAQVGTVISSVLPAPGRALLAALCQAGLKVTLSSTSPTTPSHGTVIS